MSGGGGSMLDVLSKVPDNDLVHIVWPSFLYSYFSLARCAVPQYQGTAGADPRIL